MNDESATGRYEELRRSHRWQVPKRYNIAADVCDKHPSDALAMVHEHHEGAVREVLWGELQALANQAANLLASLGVEKGDRVAVVLPPTAETAAVFFGTWKLGAILLSLSVLYGDEGIAHRINDSEPTVLVTDAANAARFEGIEGPRLLVFEPSLLAAESDRAETVAPRRRPARLPARGRLRPTQAARLPLPPRGIERLRHPDRDPLDDGHRGRPGALPPALPGRLLRRRASQPGGDPLVQGPVRRHRPRLLRPHRVLSAVRQLPLDGGPGGLDGQTASRLGRADPRRGREPRRAGRARGDLPARPLQPALAARLLAPARGLRGGLRRRVVPHQGRGARGRGRLRLVRGSGRRRDHRRRLPDRSLRGRVGLPRAPHRRRGRGSRLPDERRGSVVKAFVVLAEGTAPSDDLADEIKAFVRDRLSAYAYPRRIEFVDTLPKTLTGKIRRIELRRQEEARHEAGGG